MVISHRSKLTAVVRCAVLGCALLSTKAIPAASNSAYMARRNEDFARLGSHGGYTQALTVGKGFSGAARRDARQQGSASSGQGGGGGGGGSGTMNAYARHRELIRNYHRYEMAWFLTRRVFFLVIVSRIACPYLLVSSTSWYLELLRVRAFLVYP